MEAIEQMQQLGFSQYEAQAYIALLRENPLNGYELARASGVPRANIYHVLDRLAEMGAVMRSSAPEGVRYSPVPAEELLLKLKKRYWQSVESTADLLRQITPPLALETALNIRGYAELLEHTGALIDQAGRRLLLSIWPEEAMALAAPVQQAFERGVKITTLCLRGCPQPCPACRGAVFRYPLTPGMGTRWLLLVIDESELIAGEVYPAADREAPAQDSLAVRTRQPMLVSLTGSYIQNSIALTGLLTRLRQHPAPELDGETLAALENLSPTGERNGWLEAVQQILHPQDGNPASGSQE